MDDVIDQETGELIEARKPFGQWLLEQGNGGLHSELSEALQRVVQAVAETGKKGTLTLVVTVAPMKAPGRVLVSDDVKVKAPEERSQSIFWEHNGNLSRSNPFQEELPVREVPARDQSPIREVS